MDNGLDRSAQYNERNSFYLFRFSSAVSLKLDKDRKRRTSTSYIPDVRLQSYPKSSQRQSIDETSPTQNIHETQSTEEGAITQNHSIKEGTITENYSTEKDTITSLCAEVDNLQVTVRMSDDVFDV